MATVAAKKSNRGGARPGAGRKAQGPDGEVKEKYMGLRLYPSDRVLLEKQYGSVQAAIDSLIEPLKKKK